MRVYLDHNAAAPLRTGAREAMLEWLGPPANPSSAHREGARARQAVEEARARVASLIGALPREIVFTSGATEANNAAIRGVVSTGGGIVTTAIEHASVLATVTALGGGRGAWLVAPDGDGCVDAAAVLTAAADGVVMVSIGLANGEVGSILPVGEVAPELRRRSVVVHTDAAQAVGRVPVDVHALGVDLLSLSSAKVGGPAGVGALWIRPGTPWNPQVTGGPQERGRRAGTENVAGIVGFGAAAALAAERLPAETGRLEALGNTLWSLIEVDVPGIVRNGPRNGPRLSNTLSITVPGCTAESLLALLDLEGVAASLGSACAAGSAEPSHVLLAMGRSAAEARSTLRLSLGHDSTADDVARAGEIIPRVVKAVRRRAAA